MNADLIHSYFPEMTNHQLDQMRQLDALYQEWNSRINVISRKDIDELYLRHVLHSLGIAKVMSFKNESDILDVGTGGGFPGIPLAILFPDCKFKLVDSIGKKIKVVKEVASTLGLKNVVAEHTRAENIPEQYDFIVSRAVTKMSSFYKWVAHKVKKESFNTLNNGILYLKGGDLTEELEEFGKYNQTFDLTSYFKESFFETKKVVHVPFKV